MVGETIEKRVEEEAKVFGVTLDNGVKSVEKKVNVFFKAVFEFFFGANSVADSKNFFGILCTLAGVLYGVGLFGKPDNTILITFLSTGLGSFTLSTFTGTGK